MFVSGAKSMIVYHLQKPSKSVELEIKDQAFIFVRSWRQRVHAKTQRRMLKKLRRKRDVIPKIFMFEGSQAFCFCYKEIYLIPTISFKCEARSPNSAKTAPLRLNFVLAQKLNDFLCAFE